MPENALGETCVTKDCSAFLARKQFFHVKQEANKLKRGAISLQKIWRGRKGRETFQHVIERTNAAECIQRSYRIHNSINILERKRMHRNAARLIQRMVRRWRWRCINATIIETICRASVAATSLAGRYEPID